MGLWSGCSTCSNVEEVVEQRSSSLPRWEAAAVGLPAAELLKFVRARCSAADTTARKLVESLVLPETKGHGCSYAQLLLGGGAAPTVRPTHYVSMSWDVPLAPALLAALYHAGYDDCEEGVPTSSSHASSEPNGTSRQPSSAVGAAGTATGAVFFVDFLCIDLWGAAVSASSIASDAAIPDRQGMHRRHRKRDSNVSQRLTSPPPSASSHHYARMTSCPDLSKPVAMLQHADVEMFVTNISTVLSTSNTTFLLYLDPELNALGSLMPMHAAWRAMHAGLRMQFICSPELAWLHYGSNFANVTFTLNEAEEQDVFLREAVMNDIQDTVYTTINSRSTSQPPASDVQQLIERQLGVEEQALWRCLLRAVMLEDRSSMQRGAGHQARQTFLEAAFLALDGQYRAAKDKLLESRSAMAVWHGEQALQLVPVLCLLVHVSLQQGHLLEAQTYAQQAREACKACGSALSIAYLQAQAAHAQVLEALQQSTFAESEWRGTFIQLDQQLGPRHPLTLEFMAHLGRLVSKLRGRQEEGAMLLTECLKAVSRLASGQPAANILFPASQKQRTSQLNRVLGARQLRLEVARLSTDLAMVLRQMVGSGQEEEASNLFNCNCSSQIVAAFQSMDEAGAADGVCMLQQSSANALDEADNLWRQAVRLLETACGKQHEASCLWRARWAAEKAQPGVAQSATGNALSVPSRNGDAVGSLTAGQIAMQAPKPAEDAAEAVQCLKAELGHLKRLLGDGQHECTLQVQALLASTLDAHGMSGEAEALWRMVVNGRRLLLGEESVHLAKAMSRLADCMALRGAHSDAAQYAASAAKAMAAATGSLSAQTGAALLQEVEFYKAGGNLDAAVGALGRAVEVFRHCYGMTNWRTKQVYAAQADIYELQGRKRDAATLRATYKLKPVSE